MLFLSVYSEMFCSSWYSMPFSWEMAFQKTRLPQDDRTKGYVSLVFLSFSFFLGIRSDYIILTRMPFSQMRTIRVTHKSQKHLQIDQKIDLFSLDLDTE